VPIPGGPRPSHTPPRHLSEVADQVHAAPGATQGAAPAEDVLVSGVTLSSRTVRPGDLYAALPGQRAHGADYAAAARDAGAVAVLTDPEGVRRLAVGGVGLPVVEVADPRARLGALAAWLYGRPAERLITMGVTGTNGKTTTTFLLDGALRALDHRTGLVGTVELRVDREVVPSTGTTPEAPDLHALLAVMVERGVDVCAMEISSHALAQHRVDGLTVDVAGFTNLSQDHLDYHGTMEDYFAAKAMLFTPPYAHRAVICTDDPWGRRLAATAEQDGLPTITVNTHPTGAHGGAGSPSPGSGAVAAWQVVSIEPKQAATLAEVIAPDGRRIELAVPLPGGFNLANALLATAMLTEAYPIEPAAAAEAVARSGPVPGRMERVDAPGGASAAGAPVGVVDYAHTPDAVAAALAALRAGAKPLVVVLGAGGDRDRGKRPAMGAAAAAVADIVIVTDDNPRSEDPAAIRATVLDGARSRAGAGVLVREVPDRRAAIAAAVDAAWTDAGTGVVLVAGKGHEQGQEVTVDGVAGIHPFDDRLVLRAALEHRR